MGYNQDKLTKYRLLAKSSELAGALPKTQRLSKNGLLALLDKYEGIIAKPLGGSGGIGVISVTAGRRNTYKIHYGTETKTIAGFPFAYAYVKRKTKGAPYLIQQKIPLAKVGGRPFDARVMVQRKKGSDWTVTGKLAKIAGAGYIITNVARSKGKVAALPEAIRQSDIHGSPVKRIQGRMDRIALKAARQLSKYYPIRTVGFDVGITPNGEIWIIEANFRPVISLFLKLRDKSMYRRIKRYSLSK